MNTQAFEQFNVMDNEALSAIEGGSKPGFGEFASALAICTGSGAMIGSAFPVVGTVGGAILGAQYCTAGWGVLR
ncbi:Blp family class II bacteriocin [Streptococcus mutans]|uniref:Blp family class II bacteriocin n=2 Tax=Streptococcus mutans TaxID=1309 RepID=UPI0002C000B1|nr:Blp family class II bacteriocin [Streptococcus mutans]EMP62975.1 hypothetical protein D820_08515 [Streptococcus mutans ATCC 25175]NLQ49877.1 ComC/BlpC family peptide pheromone/bacteriocin [Streptococcus mutans]NLQ66200.1 ComC/BlpC family peptide pheromone/bacteriocin [Streptococcus mutans]QIX83943.1 ComC/BlpC family leader-containing pheromone/bacteriocin [Streptococcus mutans]QXB88678.1 Blp family class II bacteriocin [Streptococcus mutans]